MIAGEAHDHRTQPIRTQCFSVKKPLLIQEDFGSASLSSRRWSWVVGSHRCGTPRATKTMSEGLAARLTVLTRAFALVFVLSSTNADDNESARVVTTHLDTDFHTQFGSVSTRFSKPEQI